MKSLKVLLRIFLMTAIAMTLIFLYRDRLVYSLNLPTDTISLLWKARLHWIAIPSTIMTILLWVIAWLEEWENNPTNTPKQKVALKGEVIRVVREQPKAYTGKKRGRPAKVVKRGRGRPSLKQLLEK